MSQHQTIKGFETVTIISKDNVTSATFVPQRGGAASSIIMPGRTQPFELLYLHDFFWDKKISDLPGGWPFCFPVCARLEHEGKLGIYFYDGKSYELPIHGFSWLEAWSIEEEGRDYLVMALQDNERTRLHYPFAFDITLRYEVFPGKLVCHQTYCNRGKKPMPYYAGFHPYFLTPPPNAGKEKVFLNYHPTERFVYNKNYTDVIGTTDLFKLPTSISNVDIHEQLTRVGHKKEITLQFPSGDIIHLQAEGVEDDMLFSYIQLYTIPEKPFICVEPWMGYPNAMNRNGARWLGPGACDQGVLTLWCGNR